MAVQWVLLVSSFCLAFLALSASAQPSIQTANGSLYVRIPRDQQAYVQWVDDDGTMTDPDPLATQSQLDTLSDTIMKQVLALVDSTASTPVVQLQNTISHMADQIAALQANVSSLTEALDEANAVIATKLTLAPTCQCFDPAITASLNVSLQATTNLGASAYTCSSQGMLLSDLATQTCRFAARIRCPASIPGIGPGGNSSCASATEGSTCTALCNPGYYGSSTLYTCTADGLWVPSNQPSSCLAICPTLAAPADGTVSLPALLIAGQRANFTCNQGFALTGNSSSWCTSSFNWTRAPVCAPLPCSPSLTPPTNGAVNATTGVTRTVVGYSCNLGFKLVGSNVTTCQINSSWAPAAPICQALPCIGTLVAPGNGTVTGPSGTTGAIQLYTCNAGFTLVGSSATTCQPTSVWDPPAPTCSPNPCPTLPIPTFGNVTNVNGTTGVARVFSCNQGYTMSGNALTVCQTNGQWNSTAPTCIANPCTVPSILPALGNGTLSGNTGSTLTVQIYVCNAGYTLSGTSTTTCQPNGAWSSGVAPTCIPNPCPDIVAPTNGNATGTTGTTGVTRVFACATGYSLTGAPSITCTAVAGQSTSVWSAPVPTCPGLSCTPNLVAPGNGTVSSTTGTTTQVSTYACNQGFTLSGVTATTCQATRAWTSTAVPTCIAKACPVLPLLGNGTVSNRNGTTFTVRTYTCNSGYTLLGSATTTCQPNNTWSPAAPTCDANDCSPTLVAPGNGTVSGVTGEFLQTRTYACNTGFTLVGTAVRTCQSSGVWSGSAPTCSAKSCPTLVPPFNGTVSGTTGTTFTVRTFDCNQGYTLTTAALTTCQTSSTWSATTATCTPNDCPVLTAPGNGTVSGTTGYTLMTRLYGCNAGYTLVGTAMTTCTTAGTWSTPAPTCAPKACPTLAAPGNGTVSDTTGVTLDVSTYACNAGFTLTGSASTTCTTSSTWSPVAPTCVAQSCPTLAALGNGTVSGTTGTTFVVRVYTCNAGYTLVGSNVTTCTTANSWSSPAPTCAPKPCPNLTAPTNGALTALTGVTGDVRVYSCNMGYSLVGVNTTTCLTNSTWSGTARSCTGKPCSPSLTAPVNGAVSGTTGTTGITRYYSCNTGLTLTGPSLTICTIYGNWSTTVTPTCT